MIHVCIAYVDGGFTDEWIPDHQFEELYEWAYSIAVIDIVRLEVEDQQGRLLIKITGDIPTKKIAFEDLKQLRNTKEPDND